MARLTKNEISTLKSIAEKPGIEKCISYELEVAYELNGVTKQTKSYVAESDISKKNNRLKGINKVSVKSEHEESLHI